MGGSVFVLLPPNPAPMKTSADLPSVQLSSWHFSTGKGSSAEPGSMSCAIRMDLWARLPAPVSSSTWACLKPGSFPLGPLPRALLGGWGAEQGRRAPQQAVPWRVRVGADGLTSASLSGKGGEDPSGDEVGQTAPALRSHCVWRGGSDSERTQICLQRWKELARFRLVSLLGRNLNAHLLSPLW